ncbi:hypothetical protein FMUND_10951 [Fusarium mundagurra]|uniref:Apple domain-containing protein n=1 Tax=Fusarium mundagurra TaxID=1567541 RepID=A0A8H5Y843_9HYPO|nr:hypothetical protein FMUND_10951 [Fusarium mundagurra]
MQSPKSRLPLWTLLLFLSSGALSAPESCDEMGDVYTASAYSYTTACDTSLNNPIIYSTFYLGDTFAQCISRCDIDTDCSAVLYEDLSGNCYLAADFTSTTPSNSYDVAIKGPAVSDPEPSTTTTEVLIASTTDVSTTVTSTTEEASTTTEVTSEATTTQVTSAASSTEVTSEASTTEVSSITSKTELSSIATTSEESSKASSIEATSAASTTEVSTIGSTTEISSVASTSEVSSIATTSEVTSLASTSAVSSAASTSYDCDETETSSSPLSESTSAAGTTTTHSLSISTSLEAATTSQTSITSDKSTAETSSVSTLATAITSQGTESVLSTSSEITTQIHSTTTSTDIQSSPATTFESSELSTLTTLTRPASLSTTETQAITTTAKSGSTTSHGISQTVSASSASTYVYVNPGSETLSSSGSTIKAPYPTGYTIRTVYQTLTKGATCTKTTFAETVTTATYLTIGPSHSALVTACVPVTLLYSPCYCDHEVYPSLVMTTVVSPCSACGSNGENTITLTVPEVACKTTSGSYSHPFVQYPSGWTGGYQTAQNGTGYHEAQYTAKSLGQQQGSPQHTYTNVQPSIPAPTAGVYSFTQSGNNGQPSAPIRATGSPSNPQESKDRYPQESAQPKIDDETHSTQGDSAHPTGPGKTEASGTTPMVISGADKPQAIIWMMMAAMAGMVLLFN